MKNFGVSLAVLSGLSGIAFGILLYFISRDALFSSAYWLTFICWVGSMIGFAIGIIVENND